MKTRTNLLAGDMRNGERYLRIALGVAMIALGIVLPTSWGWLGIYPLITGLTGNKPVFKALGIGKTS